MGNPRKWLIANRETDPRGGRCLKRSRREIGRVKGKVAGTVSSIPATFRTFVVTYLPQANASRKQGHWYARQIPRLPTTAGDAGSHPWLSQPSPLFSYSVPDRRAWARPENSCRSARIGLVNSHRETFMFTLARGLLLSGIALCVPFAACAQQPKPDAGGAPKVTNDAGSGPTPGANATTGKADSTSVPMGSNAAGGSPPKADAGGAPKMTNDAGSGPTPGADANTGKADSTSVPTGANAAGGEKKQ